MKIHTIDLQFQDSAGLIASFLLEGPEGNILIETGPESCRETLLSKIKSLGFDPETIAGIFVTHIHLDHSGGAGWWAQQEIPVYVHPKGARHLIDPARLEESARRVYGDRFDSLWGAMTPAPEDWIRVVVDEEIIDIAGIRVEAINTPGHAFHHHAFRVDDTIFTGDAAGVRLTGLDYISVASAPPQFDLEHTLASIDRMAALHPAQIYLTHFGRIDDSQGHFSDYRDAVELNAEFVRARLAEGMDAASLQVAYEAFNLEQAFRMGVPSEDWQRYQFSNSTDMCADGIRLFWEKSAS